MNVASRRPNGSIRSTPESVATATTSPQRVAATSLPAGRGRLVGGWSPGGGGLSGGGGDEPGRVGCDKPLVGGPEHLQWHGGQGLRPRDSHAPRHRHHRSEE